MDMQHGHTVAQRAVLYHVIFYILLTFNDLTFNLLPTLTDIKIIQTKEKKSKKNKI